MEKGTKPFSAKKEIAMKSFYPHNRSLLISVINLIKDTKLGNKIAWYVKPELRKINKKLKQAPPHTKIKDILTFEEFQLFCYYS